METIEPIMQYFENKASNIICKYSSSEAVVTVSTPLKIALFDMKMQKLEHELDVEINGILSSCNNTRSVDVEALITGLYFSKEKAKYEFCKKNRY